MNNKNNELGFSTRAIHHGYNPQDHQGALIPPIYLTSTFTFATAEYGAGCFAGEESGHFYTRISNPTLALLESRMATLENGEAAVAFSSGMGAISATFWTLLRPGDEVIVGVNGVFGTRMKDVMERCGAVVHALETAASDKRVTSVVLDLDQDPRFGVVVLAEIACKAAKDRGRGRVEVFQESDQSIVRRFTDVTLVGTLRYALAHDRLDSLLRRPSDLWCSPKRYDGSFPRS